MRSTSLGHDDEDNPLGADEMTKWKEPGSLHLPIPHALRYQKETNICLI